jgi:hypothetical protein
MKSFKDLRTDKSSLHGKTVTHSTVGHSYVVKRTPGSEHNYSLYDKDGKYVSSLGGDSESAALRILKKKGYNVRD